MKRSAVFLLVVLAGLLLMSCNQGKGSEAEGENMIEVTFVNEVEDADIWILPQTEENLKTTVWG